MLVDVLSQISYTESLGDIVVGALVGSVFYPALKRLSIWVLGDRYRNWRKKRDWCYEMHEHAERMDQLNHKELQDTSSNQSPIPSWNNAYRRKMDWDPERIKDMLSQRPIGDKTDEKNNRMLILKREKPSTTDRKINEKQTASYLSLLGPNDSVVGASLMVRYLIEEEVFLFRPKNSNKLTGSGRKIAKKSYHEFKKGGTIFV